MLISTEIEIFKKYGDNRKILKMLKQAGFEAYDFSMFLQTKESFMYCDDYIKQAQALRAYADELGIVCNQTHAPFPVIFPNDKGYASHLLGLIEQGRGEPFPETENTAQDYTTLLRTLICRAVEISGILGAKNCVVHPVNDYSAEQNAQMYGEFEAVARKVGVKIAVENMWNWAQGSPTATAAACSHHDDFAKHLSLLPEDVFVACLDVGHAEMAGLNTSCVQMIEALSNRLQCMHWHDSDKLHDNHWLPFAGKIEYEPICKALAQINYQGDITMEATYFMMGIDVSLYPALASFMYQVGDYMRQRINTYKNEQQ